MDTCAKGQAPGLRDAGAIGHSQRCVERERVVPVGCIRRDKYRLFGGEIHGIWCP